jgi:hypothetical protein
MKSLRKYVRRIPIAWVIAVSALAPAALHATTALALSSFEGIEEPLVRYTPATGAFLHDDFVNITDLGGGTFRMRLRYRSDEWDADRDTPNKDRQRAEVKGLGVHQKTGETFEYSTTWRTNPGFEGAGRFCHLFQLKSTNGDSGAPLVTISILPGHERAAVQVWSGTAKSSTTVREFSWKPGEWVTVRVRIKTSNTANGEVLASVNGDEFQGARGIEAFRLEADDYRPKWGLYRGVTTAMPFGDDYVEHKNVSAQKIGAADSSPTKIETTARELLRESPAKALAWLQAQSATPARAEAIAAVTTEWAQREPASAMAFAEKLSSSEERAEAMQRVFNRWVDHDPDAVLRWATAHGPSAELDPLLWYFATDTTLRYVAREKALAGALLIRDAELRALALDHVVLIWARQEPAAAAHYVEACAGLTAAQKATMLEKIHASKS